MIDQHFALLGAAIDLLGSAAYSYLTLRGRVQPNRVTWALWAIAPGIAFAAGLTSTAGLALALVFVAGFGPLLVILASFASRSGYWKLGTFDIACGVFSLLALLLWWVTRSSNVAIIFSVAADGLAGLPTIRKAHIDPHSENATPFVGGIIGCVITLLSISRFTIANAAFTAWVLIVCTVLALQIAIGKRRGPPPRSLRLPQPAKP